MAITRYVDANIATGTGDGVLEANAYASLSGKCSRRGGERGS